MAEDKFGTEIERSMEFVERRLKADIEARLAEMNARLTDMQKRILLMLRGQQYCRLCRTADHSGIHEERLSPAPTDLERLWHEGNHGEGLPADTTRGFPNPVPGRLIDWDEFEKQVKARRPARRA